MKRFFAVVLAAAMTLGTASVAFAENTGLFELNGQRYETLQEAVDVAGKGETITLLESTSGSGVQVKSGKDFVIDFGGNTYTIAGGTVGSPGTETNGFQLLRDSDITMRNGTIIAGEYVNLRILIQNYSDLTLEDITLDARTATNCEYIASNNFGSLNVIGNTNLYAQPGQKAFDAYYWPDGGYGDGVSVTIDTAGEIVGGVEYGSDGSASGKQNVAEKAKINVLNGKIDGAVSTYNLTNDGEPKTGITVASGIFTNTSWKDYAQNTDVAAELKNGEETAYWFGPAGRSIDASDYDSVHVTKAASGSVKVDGEGVAVTNETGDTLRVNGDTIANGDTIVVTQEREERGSSTGDYFGNEKWAAVKREIAAADEGDTIKVSATGLPWFPSSVARALKGRDITLEVRKNGVTYSINGLEIGAIEKIWYEFDQIETELLTAEAPESK